MPFDFTPVANLLKSLARPAHVSHKLAHASDKAWRLKEQRPKEVMTGGGCGYDREQVCRPSRVRAALAAQIREHWSFTLHWDWIAWPMLEP